MSLGSEELAISVKTAQLRFMNGTPGICEAGSIALKLEGVTATRGSVIAP